MGKPNQRYAGKAFAGDGWYVWDRKRKKKWGNPFTYYPEELIAELNDQARPDKITQLSKPMKKPSKK